MQTRILGRTGIEVSRIGIGAWQLAGPLTLDGKTDGHPDVGADHVVDLIRRCADLGINLIDTAEQYGNGESERRVGQAIKGQRDRWILSTKFGAQVGPNGQRVNDVSARRVPLSLEDSLRRLGTDHIDIYLYHCAPDPNEAEAVAHVLEQAKRKGQIRASGISTANLEHMRYLLSLGCLDVVQFPCNIMMPQEAILAFAQQHNIGTILRGAFHNGRLSGKYFHTPPAFRPDDIRSTRFDPTTTAQEFARYSVFEELLTPQRNMVHLALRYLLDHPAAHTIILGAKTFSEYHQATQATALPPLTPSERQRIADLRSQLSA